VDWLADVLPVELLAEEDWLADLVVVDAFADSAGSSPCAIWTARPPVRASAAATATAVIFAVSAVMAGTIACQPQRSLGSG
jgi:hypothetical protein